MASLFGDLLESVGLSGMLSDGRWITLKTNGHRIKVSNDGRILAGLPGKFHGTHLGDLSKLSHEERKLLNIECGDLRTHCHTCHKTFRTKDEAFAAIMRANPELHQLQQSEFGQYDMAWLRWQRNGRRGKKPRTPITDGRLDAINEFYDLRGAARVGSFTEAVYHTIPASRRWEDLGPRLVQLEEAAGMKLSPPDEATALELAKLDVKQCEEEVDRRLGELFEKAKSGRLTDGDEPPPHEDHPGHVEGDAPPAPPAGVTPTPKCPGCGSKRMVWRERLIKSGGYWEQCPDCSGTPTGRTPACKTWCGTLDAPGDADSWLYNEVEWCSEACAVRAGAHPQAFSHTRAPTPGSTTGGGARGVGDDGGGEVPF